MGSVTRAKRTVLRGKEQQIFDLVCEKATPEQWSLWLRDPLDHALQTRNLSVVKLLLKAGADVNGGREELVCDLLLASPEDDVTKDTIHFAAALDHTGGIVEKLLSRKGIDTNTLDKEGRTPLRLAVEHGRLSAAKALLAAGADLSLRFASDDCAALDIAALRGDLDMIRTIVQHGGQSVVNVADARGYTPLHRAAFHNQAGAVDVLVGAGANVETPDKLGWTPLHDASAEGSFDAVAALLRHGANESRLDSKGRAPLHLAAERGHRRTAKVLLAGGADPSLRYGSSECSALDFAAISGHLNVMLAIMRHGADVNAAGSDGRTCLHRAAFFNQAGSIGVLVGAGADIEARDGSCGWTALHDASAEGSLCAIIALVGYKAEKNALDMKGRTPLHLASEAGQVLAARALVDARVDSNLRFGNSELSALDVAIREGHMDVLRELVEHGVDANAADSGGLTSLHGAALLDEPDAIDVLVEFGANLEARGAEGSTPLHAAAVRGSSDAIAALVRHGAHLSALDNNGLAPLHLATKHGHLYAVNSLLAARGDVLRLRGTGGDELSPLDVAAMEGRRGAIRTFIQHGVDVNAADSRGYTALHRAAFSNTVVSLDVLVSAGANLEATDNSGWTPLHDACAAGSFGALTGLLRLGANHKALDIEGRSPLHLTAQHGHLRTTEYLLATGADIGLRFGKSESSALDFAAVEGHIDILKAIIHGGADVNAVDSGGRTALHRAAFFNQSGAVDVLVKAGARVDARDSRGCTPLGIASARKSSGAAAALSKHAVEKGQPCVATKIGSALAQKDRPAGSYCFPKIVRSYSSESEDEKDSEEASAVVLIAGGGTPGKVEKYHLSNVRAHCCPSRYVQPLAKPLKVALADATWRRRGFIVLCRAHPDRVSLRSKPDTEAGEESFEAAGNEVDSARTRPLRKAAANSAGGFGNNSTGAEVWLFRLEEEGLFRNIVGFL